LTSILGVNVVASSYQQVTEQSIQWAKHRESRTLVFANVHVIMEAFDDANYRECLSQADMVNPDGVPLVWALKLLGSKKASRVYGPDCTVEMIKAAAANDVPVGFYGGSPEVLETLLAVVRRNHPTLKISFAMSPPFRKLTQEEDADVTRKITESGARILFIGLGCPKQEKWMMEHAGQIPAVMFGVGAAFDFIAGKKKQAPRWMMKTGLEWLFRFGTEPRRLAQRYIKHNPRFVFLVARQLMRGEAVDSV
jgi:N-acetylglucosaminyldiphosphoundecaprenol N-acetyl-beta-D-mannosaminyltransferase